MRWLGIAINVLNITMFDEESDYDLNGLANDALKFSFFYTDNAPLNLQPTTPLTLDIPCG